MVAETLSVFHLISSFSYHKKHPISFSKTIHEMFEYHNFSQSQSWKETIHSKQHFQFTRYVQNYNSMNLNLLIDLFNCKLQWNWKIFGLHIISIKFKDWAMIIMMPLTTGTSVFKDHNTWLLKVLTQEQFHVIIFQAQRSW